MGNNLRLQQLRNSLVPVALLALVISSSQLLAGQVETDVGAEQMLLVGVDWLAGHLHDPDIVVIDARSPAAYEKGHIPGAINLSSELTYHSRSSRRVVSQPELERLLGGIGISNDRQIVVYCDAEYLDAARLFWVLELYGHKRVSLLDGAFPVWSGDGQPVETVVRKLAPTDYLAAIRPGYMTTRLQLQLAIENPNIAVVDARETAEYQGLESLSSRAGHIPTALSYPKNLNLEERQGAMYFRSLAALETLYTALDSYTTTVLYCNGGRESSLSYLALRLLNKPVTIYDGGWHEWGNNPDLPIESPGS